MHTVTSPQLTQQPRAIGGVLGAAGRRRRVGGGGKAAGTPSPSPDLLSGRTGAKVGLEGLLGEPPHPRTELHAVKQLLVLVDPAHRHAQRLGHLLHGEVPAHRTLPETTTRPPRGWTGTAGTAGDRTTVHSSPAAASSLRTSEATSGSGAPTGGEAARS